MKKIFNFKRNIKNKLIFSFVSLIVVSLLLLGIITYVIVANQTKNDYTNFIHKEIIHVNDGIEKYLELIKENTLMVSKSPLIQGADSRITSYVEKKDPSGKVQMTPLENNIYEAEVYNNFKNFKEAHPEISSVSLAVQSNGGYVQYPASARTNGYDARERDWYKLAVQNPDKPVFSDVYISSDGSKSIICMEAVKDSTGTIKGVATMNINLDKLTKMIEDIDIGKNGYIVLVDNNGTILANPKDTSLVSKKVEELNISNLDITNDNNNSLETKMPDGNNYSISVQKPSSSGLNWTYICFVETSEFISSAKSIGMITILFIMIFTVLSIVITIFIAQKITNPISNISSYLKAIGKGDFSIEIDSKYLNINDEVGEIAKSTKTMQTSLKETLLAIQNHSNAINNKAENLHEAAESVANSSGEVNNAIQDVAKGADNQSYNLLDVTNILSDFANEIELMTTILFDVKEKTNSISKIATKGNNNMTGLVHSVESVDITFKEFAEKINVLGRNVNKVNEITNLIDSISEQTNLLALNAAIEASRSGEAGKGFAVVADEIKKLADQSKKSANEIAQLIGNITNDTGDILRNNDNMKVELTNQLTGINSTIKSFKEIVSEIGNMIPKINNANFSAENINKEKDNILDKVQNISAISEETSASSQEIAASSQAMSGTSENLFSTVDNLRDMAKEMREQVDNFKLQ